MPALPFPPLMIGPLGMQEMLIIMVVALIVFGPRKLPQIGKTLGKSLAEFRRTSTELRNTLEREVEMEEFRSARDEVSGLGRDLGGGLDPTGGAPPAARRSAEGAGAPKAGGPKAEPPKAGAPKAGDPSAPGGARDTPPDEEADPGEAADDPGGSGDDAAPEGADAAGSETEGVSGDLRDPKEAAGAGAGAPPDRETEPNAAGG